MAWRLRDRHGQSEGGIHFFPPLSEPMGASVTTHDGWRNYGFSHFVTVIVITTSLCPASESLVCDPLILSFLTLPLYFFNFSFPDNLCLLVLSCEGTLHGRPVSFRVVREFKGHFVSVRRSLDLSQRLSVDISLFHRFFWSFCYFFCFVFWLLDIVALHGVSTGGQA